MKLIIGLGNPGQKYTLTRHNSGARAVAALGGEAKWRLEKKFQAQIAEFVLNGEKIILAKPQTFMNNSGQAARALARFYKLRPSAILVIYDDIDLLVGQTRLRSAGSAGGHQGMASIIASLGTDKIARLRLGIAEEKPGKQTIPSEDYVLQKFTKVGKEKIERVLKEIPDKISNWIK